MENSFLKPSKKKQFSKNNSLTSVESLKTPKLRRKSLGTILPTPKVSQKSLGLSRRKSVDSEQIVKKSKKQISEKSSSNTTEVSNHSNGKYVKLSSKPLPNLTPRKAVKRRSSNSEPSETKVEFNKVPLVLAPRKKEKSSSLAKESENIKKNPQDEPTFQDDSNTENKKRNQDLEKKFTIKSTDVKNAVTGVIKFASNNPHLQNQLFNEEIPLFLQVNSFKIPKTKGPIKQLFRVPMQHSVLPSEADICFIVPDVKGIKNNEHEKHLEYYENLLRSKDVMGIKKIMTFHEFRTEYETFELKNRLVDLYDVFLVDGKISGKVVNKCGSIFYKKRKVPIAVKLYLPKLRSHIEKALRKAYFHLNVKSDSHTVQIGYSTSSIENLVDNVYSIVEFVDKQFPGRMNNIRSLNVYAHRGSSIPIYLSLKNPNEVKVPTLSNKKPKAYKSFSGELTTQYNADVVVRPSGQVVVRRKALAKQKDENTDDNITDAEILRENRIIDQMEQQNGDGSNKNIKGGKKRKLSEPAKEKQESNPTQLTQDGSKKIKREKRLSLSVNQEVNGQTAEKTTKGDKGKKKTSKGNRNTPKKSTTGENQQKTLKKKTTIVTTKTKLVEKGRRATKQRMGKNTKR